MVLPKSLLVVKYMCDWFWEIMDILARKAV